MPYNSGTGVYTPVNGATNAAAGQLIASAIWNNIHTDFATALTSLGQGMLPIISSVAGAKNTFFSTATVVASFGGVAGTDIATIAVPLPAGLSGFYLSSMYIYNASANLNSPQVALYTAASGGGTQIISSFSVKVASSLPNTANSLALAFPAGATVSYQAAQVFLHITASTASATSGSASVTVQYEPSY